MRRNIKNDKVLRAITIGLATMIAATSAPVTVLADDNNGSGEGNNAQTENAQTPCEKTAEQASTAEKAVETAAESVKAAQTIVTDGAEATSETPAVAPASTADGISQDTQNKITTLINRADENSSAITAEPIVIVLDETTGQPVELKEKQGKKMVPVYQPVADCFEDVEQALVTDPTTALTQTGGTNNVTQNVDSAQSALQTAAKEDKVAEENAEAVVTNTVSGSDIASAAQSSVEKAGKEADLIDTINSATSDDNAKREAFERLDKLTSDTETDIKNKRAAFNEISDKFYAAKDALEKAEENYENALKNAGSSAALAKKGLEQAQKYVKNLQAAYNNAKSNLDKTRVMRSQKKKRSATVSPVRISRHKEM